MVVKVLASLKLCSESSESIFPAQQHEWCALEVYIKCRFCNLLHAVAVRLQFLARKHFGNAMHDQTLPLLTPGVDLSQSCKDPHETRCC